MSGMPKTSYLRDLVHHYILNCHQIEKIKYSLSFAHKKYKLYFDEALQIEEYGFGRHDIKHWDHSSEVSHHKIVSQKLC